ncbi:Protein of unknown function [Streptococcus thermophilus]|nr:Protein of unknown function [Streptococcus thermophilus]
MSLFVLI